MKMKKIKASEDQIKRARQEYGSEDVEIDDNAKISIGEDGVWVRAWVWLANK